MGPTPCGVLYDVIGEVVGKRRYEEIDAAILSRRPFGKKQVSPYDHALTNKTWRTRELIQKDPRELPPFYFRDIQSATYAVAGLYSDNGMSCAQATAHVVSTGVGPMVQSLREYGYEEYLLLNTIQDILRSSEINDPDCLAGILAVYLGVAFYGDPRIAIQRAFEFRGTLFPSISPSTEIVPTQTADDNSGILDGNQGLALVRCHADGSVEGTMNILNSNPEGTIIGRVATAEAAISNVDPTVSRQHLQVFCKDGRWFARGMGSVNGSKVLHADGTLEVIESKKGKTPVVSATVEIFPDDILMLGNRTKFKAVLIAGK